MSGYGGIRSVTQALWKSTTNSLSTIISLLAHHLYQRHQRSLLLTHQQEQQEVLLLSKRQKYKVGWMEMH
jgi:hypothetical protein